jgi:hypothetical protein
MGAGVTGSMYSGVTAGERYLKEVDAQETTVRFWQEIYDDQSNLVEIHEKYPVDKGHQKL